MEAWVMKFENVKDREKVEKYGAAFRNLDMVRNTNTDDSNIYIQLVGARKDIDEILKYASDEKMKFTGKERKMIGFPNNT
jgi:hypothetical protein